MHCCPVVESDVQVNLLPSIAPKLLGNPVTTRSGQGKLSRCWNSSSLPAYDSFASVVAL
jgi:hypothetical protein